MSTPSHHDSPAGQRDRSIRLAVITSLVSKMGTIVLRLVSIPIAIRLLGMDQFGVYTAITLAVGIIDIMHVGIGPALTRELTKALARGNREKEKTVFATSVILSTSLTLLMAAVAAVLLFTVPIPTLFGTDFADVSEVMYRAAWLGFGIILVEMICVTFEMGRDGYQETRYTNTWGAAGNIVSAATLLIGIWFFPTIEFLILAVNGAIALAKLGNTIHLLIQRPYLLPRFSLFRRKLVPSLAKDSLRFSVTYILAAMVEYNLMAFLIGRHAGPSAVGAFNIMITIHFSAAGLVSMVTRPYWPALMEAFERHDKAWISRSSKRLLALGLGFGAATSIGLVAFGQWLLPLWVGNEITEVPEGFEINRLALLAFGLYFTLHVWRHMNQTLALGVGRINQVVVVVLLEAVTVFGLASLALENTGKISAVYFAIALALLLVSGWRLPMLFVKELQAPAEKKTAAEAKTLEAVDKIATGTS